MARPGSKAAKKRDPRRAEEWPPRTYPLMITKPNLDIPVYKGSIAEVREYLRKDIEAFRKQFKFLGDTEVLEACEQILRKIVTLQPDQVIDQVIDPRTQLRYKVTVTRRPYTP